MKRTAQTESNLRSEYLHLLEQKIARDRETTGTTMLMDEVMGSKQQIESQTLELKRKVRLKISTAFVWSFSCLKGKIDGR